MGPNIFKRLNFSAKFLLVILKADFHIGSPKKKHKNWRVSTAQIGANSDLLTSKTRGSIADLINYFRARVKTSEQSRSWRFFQVHFSDPSIYIYIYIIHSIYIYTVYIYIDIYIYIYAMCFHSLPFFFPGPVLNSRRISPLGTF